MKNEITSIIFDLGGVLVDWNPNYLYLKAFDEDIQKMNWFLSTVCNSDWNIKQDEGRTIAEAEAEKITAFPEYETYIKLYYKNWHQMFSGPIHQNVELFQNLKTTNKYKIYALTNWSAEKWDKALELFPFFDDFDGVVVSGKEKTRKPFPEIYQIIISRYNLSPKNTVFIDDNSENVKTAATFGFNSVHYTSHVDLKKDLKNLGISI